MTGRQVAANRANAGRSTGPRTAAGKARAAGNARRHGLTARPELEAVARWYCIILADPGARPSPLEQDPCLRAARDLAEAEAQLERVRLAEERYFLDPEGPPSQTEEEMRAERDFIRGWLAHMELEQELPQGRLRRELGVLSPREHARWRWQGQRLIERGLRLQLSARWRRLKSRRRLERTLQRYRARAEARRRKALRRWTVEFAKRSHLQPVVV